MKVFILALVVIGILLAIGSGVWVAIALVRAISTRRTSFAAPRQSSERSGSQGIK